jgi:tetratricopeptide (TPR) repeat protein
MRKAQYVAFLIIAFVTAGCASFRVAGQVQSGRRALLMNDPETALAYLLQAAERDPNYIYSSVGFQESVWTYIGRAQYSLGRFVEARRSFERALSVYKDDAMARLYLGLAKARSGEREQGIKNVQLGLKGLWEWIEFLNRSKPYYAFWDPRGDIRKEIDKTLALASGEQAAPLETVVASAEWIGQQMEEEIDKVRSDERREFDRNLDRDGRRGVSFGLGIGF